MTAERAPGCFYAPAVIPVQAWIPACAGMTIQASGKGMPRYRIALTPSSGWVVHSPSFRRRPESSGLDNLFPHSGNDNHRHVHLTRHLIKPAVSSLPGPPSWIPAFAGMTIRAYGEGMPRYRIALTSNCGQIVHSPSFRRRPESSGLDNLFPHSGNDNHRHVHLTRHLIKPAVPSPAGPPLPGFRPAPACCRQAQAAEDILYVATGPKSAPQPDSRIPRPRV